MKEPSYPINEPPELPPEVEEIISSLKLLYMLGGEATVRTALDEAGVEKRRSTAWCTTSSIR
ncbi:MAG: hypothetical protein HC915_06095 [Anaerolineae bacterium]|nr:hypothetical protein [Anaerolineae bacterium]